VAHSPGGPVTSRLFPFVDGHYAIQTVNFAGRDWRFDDYSYAGYFLGQQSLGSVPCNVMTVSATGDISQAVQDAINTVGTAGGGIVQIPAGTFVMGSSVEVPYNNVSIEGAGSGQTLINVPSNYIFRDPRYEGVFTFGRAIADFAHRNEGWVYRGPEVSTVSTVVNRGDLLITADNPSGINIGDWIVLQQYFWQPLVDNNSGSPDHWVPNTDRLFSFSYLRQVTAIQGNSVFIDAPIPWTLDPANNRIVIRLTDGKMKENVGIKGMTFSFANQPVTGRPSGAAAYFEGVRNGWAYDVVVNNIPRFGLYSQTCARITFLNCAVQQAQDYGGDGYGYGYHCYATQNALIKRCRGEDTRHNFLSQRALTSMLVMTQCSSVNATEPDETHHSFEHAILWDKHTQLNGDSIYGLNRGDESTGAYETLGSGVIWNFSGDGVKGRLSHGGEIHFKPSPDGWGVVIGVDGAHTVWDNTSLLPWVQGDQVLASPDLQVGPDPAALHNVLYEWLHAGVGWAWSDSCGVQPDSLYETLLTNRIDPPPTDFRGPC